MITPTSLDLLFYNANNRAQARFVRYTKKVCYGNGIVVSSGTVYRAWYLTKQFYKGDISIPWQLVIQLDISDARLCENVGKVLQVMPNAGETYIIGLLRSRGMRVQRWRIREAISTMDPVSRALTQCRADLRRKYNVPCPNALW